MLEQEMASIAKFIYDVTDKPKLYYHDMPEDFAVPSIYFPAEDIGQRSDTFNDYAFEYSWAIKFFHKNTRLAMENGKAALSSISANRNLIPILEENGASSGRGLRLKKATITAGDSGAAIMTLSWTSIRPYNRTAEMYAQEFEIYIEALTTKF